MAISLETCNHEQEVLSTIEEIEEPFMRALQQEFGADRGWQICGPGSVAISQILSARHSIPIGQSLPGEHLELAIWTHDPKQAPDRFTRFWEQTFVLYYIGDGNVLYIDVTYRLPLKDSHSFQGAILVEKYPLDTLKSSLIDNHSLYPFNPEHESIERIGAWADYDSCWERRLAHTIWENHLNSSEATMPCIFTNWEKHPTIETNISRVRWIIELFTENSANQYNQSCTDNKLAA